MRIPGPAAIALIVLAVPQLCTGALDRGVDVELAGRSLALIDASTHDLAESIRAMHKDRGPISPAQLRFEGCVGELAQAADHLRDGLAQRETPIDERALWMELSVAEDRVERAGEEATLTSDQWEHVSNVRWNVRQLSKILLIDGGPQTFVVGPVSSAQAIQMVASLDGLSLAAQRLSQVLTQSPGEITYRNLLLEQMNALSDPADQIRRAVTGADAWWNFATNQSVTRLLRVIALTQRETRNLPADATQLLDELWTASARVRASANVIEGGAREAGEDAIMVYRPIKALQASR